MHHDHLYCSATYQDETLTLMVCVLVFAMTLLIGGGILVTQAEAFLG